MLQVKELQNFQEVDPASLASAPPPEGEETEETLIETVYPSAPPMEDMVDESLGLVAQAGPNVDVKGGKGEIGFVDSEKKKNEDEGFLSKVFKIFKGKEWVPSLTREERENGMCYGGTFQIHPDEAMELIEKWIGSLWWAPADLTMANVKIDSVLPLNIPFYAFTITTNSR